MKVAVYFESPTGAHMVAQFDDESTYMRAYPHSSSWPRAVAIS